MRMVIQRDNGFRVDAVLLALNKNQMRVMVAGTSDTVELTLQSGCWMDEAGKPVIFEAFLPFEGIGWSRLCSDVYPRTAGVGSTFN